MDDERVEQNLAELLTAFAETAAENIKANEQSPEWEFGSYEPVLASVPWSYMPTMYDATNFNSTLAYLASDKFEFFEICRRAVMNLRGMKSWKAKDFLAGMVSSARRRIYFEGKDLTGELLARFLLENYANLERAADKRPVITTTILGLTSVRLAHGEVITTPWGLLHSNLPAEKRPNKSERPTASAILVAQYETTTVYGAQKPIDGLEKIRHLLPLGFALESTPGNRRCPTVTFYAYLHPWQTGNSTGLTAIPPLVPWPILVGAELARAIESRLVSLAMHDSAGLLIAARRTVQALVERTNDADRLIDAVTAWESLVGHRAETTFFVSFALTRLLENPSVSRMTQMREIKDLYTARSMIVHGKTVDNRKLAAQAERATELSLMALDKLYERDEKWLKLDAEARAALLILDEEPTT